MKASCMTSTQCCLTAMTESWQLPSPALGSKLQKFFAPYSLFVLPFVSWKHTLNLLVFVTAACCLTIVTPLSQSEWLVNCTSVRCCMQKCRLSVFCCRYSGKVQDYNKAYEGAKAAIINKFYGPPNKGVFSPSVQYTLYQMALEILAK